MPLFCPPCRNNSPLGRPPPAPTETNTHPLTHTRSKLGPGFGLPVDRVLVPLQGVVDSGSHTGRHDIGVRGVSAVVLRGVERRPVVQVVNRGDRPRRVRVSVHGSGDPYSVHPAVMGQLIVLSGPGQGKGGGGRRQGEQRGRRRRQPRREREPRCGKGRETERESEKDEGQRGGGGGREERERERDKNKNKVRKQKSTQHKLNTRKPNQPKQRS